MYLDINKDIYSKFKNGQYHYYPIFTEITEIEIDPCEAYEKISHPHKMLLHSSQVSKTAQFSFVVFDPELIIEIKNHKVYVNKEEIKEEVRAFLTSLTKKTTAPKSNVSPFIGGITGLISYEAHQYFEPHIKISSDDLKIPDLYLFLARKTIVFDHHTEKTYFVSLETKNYSIAYEKHNDEFKKLQLELNKKVRQKKQESKEEELEQELQSNFKYEDYINSIQTIKDKIKHGYTYQANLSQRYDKKVKCKPFELYKDLIKRSPVHYSAYLENKDFSLICASLRNFLNSKVIK